MGRSRPRAVGDLARVTTQVRADNNASPELRTEPCRPKRRRRLTIGELARRAGVGVEAVRYYQKRGLLTQPERPSRGYRVYSDETLERLTFIRRAREVGFPVDAIAELLRRRDAQEDSCSEVRRCLMRQVETLEDAIRELDSRRRFVLDLICSCRAEKDQRGAQCQTLEAFYRGTMEGSS